MNSKSFSDESTVSADIGHFINYVRVATAIAIIRSKPANVSVLQHARDVCGNCVKNQLHWKEKASQLETEVLSLKQKLVMTRINQIKRDTENSGEAQSQSQPLPPIYPTPPNSTAIETDPLTNSDHRLNDHVLFLKSVMTLKSIAQLKNTNSNNSRNCTASPSLLDTLAAETSLKTVHSSLEIIQNWLCDPEKFGVLSFKVIEHSVSVIVQLVQGKDQVTGQSKELYCDACEAVQTFAQNVIRAMLYCSEDYPAEFQQHLQRILQQFSGSHELRCKVVMFLVQCIYEYSETLRDVLIGQEHSIETQTFQNVYTIFQTLEHILEFELREKNVKYVSIRKSACQKMAAMLEESLLHISEAFPLFAHFVWHLGSVFDELLRKRKFMS